MKHSPLYPIGPQSFDNQKLQPSSGFKSQVGAVILSIILFLIVYLILVVVAAALAVGCFYLGINIIVASPGFLTIALGLGLMATGGSILFFLIKFVFAVNKDENNDRVEIEEKDQPELFAFIRRLSKETNTPFPKKIFLSPNVNACVFYNSSFWSMFFPVKKNLEIGLGLVNSINISEFKAVIAHEFGHFSQRSMKLGSFTYNVNKVIYNMLFENTGYANFLSSWGRIDGLLGLFAVITSKVAVGIQNLLKMMYKVINKSYMGLSREMEFHADAVAASVAGGNNLISGLARIEVAAGCYSSAINRANDYLKKNKVSQNIYNNQLSILQFFAREHSLPIRNELPEVSYHFISSFSTSRVNYKNQWASHPTLEERKKHTDELAMNCAALENRAWDLFANVGSLQETVTQSLYKTAVIEGETETFDTALFEQWHYQELEKFQLPKQYKGYYDNRYPELKTWNFDEIFVSGGPVDFDELFTEDTVKLYAAIRSNEEDINLVKAIKEKNVDTKTFDFDGRKTNREEADEIIKQLEAEIDDQKKQLAELDQRVARFFYNKAKTKGEDLKTYYTSLRTLELKHDSYIEVTDKLFATIAPFYHGELTENYIHQIIQELKDGPEADLKKAFTLMLDEHFLNEQEHAALTAEVRSFLTKSYVYFSATEFNNNELQELTHLAIAVSNICNEKRFAQYKQALTAQLQYANLF